MKDRFITLFQFRIDPCMGGDGINIQRRVYGMIVDGEKRIRKEDKEYWMPYCYVNTDATMSTQTEADRLVELLNKTEQEKENA